MTQVVAEDLCRPPPHYPLHLQTVVYELWVLLHLPEACSTNCVIWQLYEVAFEEVLVL